MFYLCSILLSTSAICGSAVANVYSPAATVCVGRVSLGEVLILSIDCPASSCQPCLHIFPLPHVFPLILLSSRVTSSTQLLFGMNTVYHTSIKTEQKVILLCFFVFRDQLLLWTWILNSLICPTPILVFLENISKNGNLGRALWNNNSTAKNCACTSLSLCACVNLCVRQPSDIGMTYSRLNKHPQMKNCIRGTRLMSDTTRTINLKNVVWKKCFFHTHTQKEYMEIKTASEIVCPFSLTMEEILA